MRRGEAWIAASAGNRYASKAQPVLMGQDDHFDATDSIAVCSLTTDATEIPLLQIPLHPGVTTGLAKPSSLVLDEFTTMPRPKPSDGIGALSDTDMLALSRSLMVFLELA